jgi:hypothetical protein
MILNKISLNVVLLKYVHTLKPPILELRLTGDKMVNNENSKN